MKPISKTLITGALVLSLTSCFAAEEGSKKTTAQIEKIEKRVNDIVAALKHKGLDVDATLEEIANQNKAHEIPVDGSASIGPENAEITIVEFSDLQCPYCARTAPIVKAIQEKYPNKVRVVFKHFPLSFHKAAPGAHAASIAAQNQGKFFEFRYEVAPEYKTLTEAVFVRIAEKIGLDMDKFKSDMVVGTDDLQRFQKDMALGQKIGVRGTPSYFINGKVAKGFSAAMVEEMLSK
jgi:protein-disulfide isomerase